MRNLTLGLLIVASGTLAALPFRRTQSVDPPIPETSPLDPVSLSNPAFPSPIGMLVDQSEPQAEWLDRLVPEPRETPPPWQNQRELSAPLTYEELAVPITRPEKIEQRFSATQPVQTSAPHNLIEANSNRFIASAAPLVNSNVRTQNQPEQERSVLIAEPAEQTTLASTPLGESTLEQLPKQETSERQRFWIRQP